MLKLNNNFIVGIYKEIGKNPEIKKVKNTIEDLENLINGKFEIINFENSLILYNKDNKNYKPNIWLDNGFLQLGNTIRGNIFIINRDKNQNFISLTNKQLFHYPILLNKKSFNYTKKYSKNSLLTLKASENKKTENNQEETLKMLFGIQAIILKYLKNNT